MSVNNQHFKRAILHSVLFAVLLNQSMANKNRGWLPNAAPPKSKMEQIEVGRFADSSFGNYAILREEGKDLRMVM